MIVSIRRIVSVFSNSQLRNLRNLQRHYKQKVFIKGRYNGRLEQFVIILLERSSSKVAAFIVIFSLVLFPAVYF